MSDKSTSAQSGWWQGYSQYDNGRGRCTWDDVTRYGLIQLRLTSTGRGAGMANWKNVHMLFTANGNFQTHLYRCISFYALPFFLQVFAGLLLYWLRCTAVTHDTSNYVQDEVGQATNPPPATAFYSKTTASKDINRSHRHLLWSFLWNYKSVGTAGPVALLLFHNYVWEAWLFCFTARSLI